MRRVTRNAVLLILAVLAALLALGAIPSVLGSGDPYYVTAESVGDGRANATAEGDGDDAAAPDASAAVNGSALSERRFPYTTEALRNGTSKMYRKGPWGLKEAFTHSPFDERDALAARSAATGAGGGALVSHNGTLYRVAVRQQV